MTKHISDAHTSPTIKQISSYSSIIECSLTFLFFVDISLKKNRNYFSGDSDSEVKAMYSADACLLQPQDTECRLSRCGEGEVLSTQWVRNEQLLFASRDIGKHIWGEKFAKLKSLSLGAIVGNKRFIEILFCSAGYLRC